MKKGSFVRLYQPQDRKAVRYICCETGFMGEPMELAMSGREVFADLWSSYYTDYEPEHVWVAVSDGEVVGYLLGALNTHRQERITFTRIFPKIVLKAFITDCISSTRMRKHILELVKSIRRGEMKTPDLSLEYPAHLHTNILEGYRGLGLGKKMMLCWFEHLAEHGVKGLHLVTTNRNRLAIPFYLHMGFKVLFEAPISMYDYLIHEPVYLVGMGIKF